MTAENFAGALRVFRATVPFKPFVLQLASGTVVDVDHPEALVYRGKGMGVHVSQEGTLTLFDHDSVVQVTYFPDQFASLP